MEATPEKTESNIRSVLRAFENFHKLLENDSAFSNVSKEDVKDYFKLAIFIEKAIINFQEKDCVDNFFSVLHSYCQAKFCANVNYKEFYGRACDHMLSKFFAEKNFKLSIIDVAIRMYTALLPKERLEFMLTDFILTSVSCTSILNYAVANKNVINGNELQAHILLESWVNQLDREKNSDVLESISNMLSVYKIRSSLPLLIKISVIDCNEKQNKIKQIIFDVLLKRMMDRSVLSKAFWLCIFKDVNRQDLMKLCRLKQEFLLHLSKFIVYLGSMMTKVENRWYGDENLSICPEITFDEMLALVRSLKNDDCLKKYFCKVFRDANTNTGLTIWKEFEQNYIHEFL